MNKSDARTEALRRRRALDAERRQLLDMLVFERAHKFRPFQLADVVHVFRSTDDEINTWPFIEYAWGIGKSVYVPVSDHATHTLRHVQIDRHTNWTKGMYGILEPVVTPISNIVSASFFGSNTAVVVPIVAFDPSRRRVGYGKGYYDRFLAESTAPTLGIAYECQKFPTIDFEEHDVVLTAIATDHTWYVA